MIRLTELHQTAGDRDPEGVREMPEHVMRAHRRVVDAVVAGDVDLARTRMRRHLAALASWLE
jgi:DNA-binding FadR family transcriptional regulator